jgi:hypothetical protein
VVFGERVVLRTIVAVGAGVDVGGAGVAEFTCASVDAWGAGSCGVGASVMLAFGVVTAEGWVERRCHSVSPVIRTMPKVAPTARLTECRRESIGDFEVGVSASSVEAWALARFEAEAWVPSED